MRGTHILRIEPDDVPVAKITGNGHIELNLCSQPGAAYHALMVMPSQAEQIVNALVAALAALKVPK